MGSGSVGVAALRLGRRFAGTDLNPQAVRLAADTFARVRRRPGTGRTAARVATGPARADGLAGSRVDAAAEYAELWSRPTSPAVIGARGLKVYREIRIGKSIIGKDRCIDVFCVSRRREGVRDRVQVPGESRAPSTKRSRTRSRICARCR